MKSKTSLFNRTIFLNLLERYWIVFVAYLGAMSVCVLMPLINALQDRYRYNAEVPLYASFIELLNMTPTSVLVLNFVAAGVVAALLFSYLYNARHTGMMASLPVRRETVYLSTAAAGFAGFTAANVVVIVMALVIELIYGQVSLLGLGILFAVSELSLLLFFGMATFCCMLTGNIFAGPAVYAIFNAVAVGAESLVVFLLQETTFGMCYSHDYFTTFLSPLVQVVNSVRFSYHMIRDEIGKFVDYTWEMHGMGVLAVYAVVGLVLLWLGLKLYQNRRMETAGDTVAIEVLKPIFKTCMTVGSGLLFAVFIHELLYEITPTGTLAATYSAVLLIIGGIVGYFVGKMLIEKTVWVFRTGWKTVGIYALAVVLVSAAVECDLFGYEKRVPAAEDVEKVSVLYQGDDLIFDEPENIQAIVQLHRNIIANKSLHELGFGASVAVDYAYGKGEYANLNKTYINLEYTLKNGRTMMRSYDISYGPEEIRNNASEIRALEALLNTEEGIAERYVLDYPVTMQNVENGWVSYVDASSYEHLSFEDFSPSEVAKLYNECILPDIADGNLGVLNIIEDRDYALSKYNCVINIEVFHEKTYENGSGTYNDYRFLSIYPTLTASRTMEFLKEYGIEPATVYDSKVAEGFDYNDLGQYYVDEDGTADSIDRETMEKMTQENGVKIGGATAQTDIVVTG